MTAFRWSVLCGSLLMGALLACAAIYAADPAPDATSANKGPALASAHELAALTRAPLLLDAPRAAGWNKAQLSSRPVPPIGDFSPPPPGSMRVGLEILVNGRPLPTIAYGGKTYLPVARLGTEYEIRVSNHGPRRIVAMVSVDGLSVISGKPASEKQAGYVVSPYNSILIQGWRRSLDTVAAFRFIERDKSYAALTGRPENIGVIGLIAVEEQLWQRGPALQKAEGGGPAAARARRDVGKAGTEYGRDLDSRAYYVPFLRSNNKRTVTIFYDTVAALREAGVPVDHPLPDPFPGDMDFAPPPPRRGAR